MIKPHTIASPQAISTALTMCILLMLGGCDWLDKTADSFRDKKSAFAPIATGSNGWSRVAVEQAMGAPEKVESAGLAGLEAEYLYFTDRSTHYRVLLVNGKAWLKTASPLSNPTTSKELK